MRTGFATVLVLLGCLLAAPAVVAFVLVDEVTDRATYLEAVTPLADDPAVQEEVSGQISAALDDKVPAAAKQLVDASIDNFVQSDQFRETWVRLNTEVHPQLLALLRDEPGSLAVEGDAIMLDLGVAADEVKARLVADEVPLAERIPTVDAKMELVSGPAVRQIVPAFDLVEKLKDILPVAAVLLIVAGLALSARRGVTLVVTGFGLVLAMVIVVLAQFLLRSEVTARSPAPELAGPFYDAVTGRLSIVLWVICGIGGVFVIVGGILARRANRPAAGPPARDYAFGR
jgi:hypothetical protein